MKIGQEEGAKCHGIVVKWVLCKEERVLALKAELKCFRLGTVTVQMRETSRHKKGKQMRINLDTAFVWKNATIGGLENA